MPINDEQYFIELYIFAKRSIMKNNFIKIPRIGSKQYQCLIEAANLVKQLHANPIKFIKFFIKYLSPLRVFPQPYHLISKKLVEKFKYYQALKNIYEYDDYLIDGDSFTINETYEVVSYRNEIMVPVDKDIRLKTAIFLSSQDNPNLTDKDKRDIIYAVTKLKFLQKPIPEGLIQLKERISKDASNQM